MSGRRVVLVAVLAVAAVGAVIAGVYLLGIRDSCMNVMSGGSCPTLAEVDGARYTVSVGMELVDIEPDLTAFGEITRSNVPAIFADTTAYAVSGIHPAVLLVAHANEQFDAGDGPYRLLFAHSGSREGVWPRFCDYLPVIERHIKECSVSA